MLNTSTGAPCHLGVGGASARACGVAFLGSLPAPALPLPHSAQPAWQSVRVSVPASGSSDRRTHGGGRSCIAHTTEHAIGAALDWSHNAAAA